MKMITILFIFAITLLGCSTPNNDIEDSTIENAPYTEHIDRNKYIKLKDIII